MSLIQVGDWKLMEFLEDGRLELYNVREDVSESKNMAKSKPELAKELQKRLVAWREATGAPMPTKNDAQGDQTTKPKPKKGKGKKKANAT